MKITITDQEYKEDFHGSLDQAIEECTKTYLDYYGRGIESRVDYLESECQNYHSMINRILTELIKNDTINEEALKNILAIYKGKLKIDK